MSIDLRECKPGDKPLSVHGKVFEYVRRLPQGSYYDHEIKDLGGFMVTRIDSGHVYRNPPSRMDCDHDIVKILKEK